MTTNLAVSRTSVKGAKPGVGLDAIQSHQVDSFRLRAGFSPGKQEVSTAWGRDLPVDHQPMYVPRDAHRLIRPDLLIGSQVAQPCDYST
jgi:hypothetical protein